MKERKKERKTKGKTVKRAHTRKLDRLSLLFLFSLCFPIPIPILILILPSFLVLTFPHFIC